MADKDEPRGAARRKRKFVPIPTSLLGHEEVLRPSGSKTNATGVSPQKNRKPEFGQIRYRCWIYLLIVCFAFTITATQTAETDDSDDYSVLPEEYQPAAYKTRHTKKDHQLPVSVTINNGLWIQKRPHKRIYNTFIPMHYVFSLANPSQLGTQQTLYWEGKRVAI